MLRIHVLTGRVIKMRFVVSDFITAPTVYCFANIIQNVYYPDRENVVLMKTIVVKATLNFTKCV